MTILARTPDQLGNAIRRMRKQAGLSQQALAEKCGLWQETISKIERGLPGAKIETIMQIMAALDLELVVRPRTRGNLDYLEEML
jgi:HTH-type transcriptional regulator/antitoxin HipB